MTTDITLRKHWALVYLYGSGIQSLAHPKLAEFHLINLGFDRLKARQK